MAQPVPLDEPPGTASSEMDETAARILDAAMAQFLRVGLRNTTMKSVAKAAGVSHMTVFRRWGSRAGLEQAVVAREAQRLAALLDDMAASTPDPVDRLVEAFVTVYRFGRGHALLRLLETDQETVLPLLTTGIGPALVFGRTYLAEHLRRAQAAGEIRQFDPDGVAELLVRVVHSLVLIPESISPLETDDDARAYARQYFEPMLRQTMTPPR